MKRMGHHALRHLGNARWVYGNNGVWERSDYYPFGGERVISSGAGNRYKFFSKERDTESGLDFFGARYYAGFVGRFTTPDPLMASGTPDDPQTWNRYAYALNNPLGLVDPDGLETIPPPEHCHQSGSTCPTPEEERQKHVIDYTRPHIAQNQEPSDGPICSGVACAYAILHYAEHGEDYVKDYAIGFAKAFGSPFGGSGPSNETQEAGFEFGSQVLEELPWVVMAVSGPKSGPKAGSSGGPSAGKRPTKAERAEALRENERRCVFCGKPANQVDHAVPRSRGGNTTKANLQPCDGCNQVKGNKTTREFIRWRKSKF